MDKLDYKKAFPELYLPPRQPAVIDVPALPFIMVEGCGDPNEPDGAYQQALQLLYGLSFTISMSGKGGYAPEGYFPYVVPPLEGLWWMREGGMPDFVHKERFCWISMIRQPEFVTQEVFSWAQEQVLHKKRLDASHARLEIYTEGLCVQCMHIGPYDEEPRTLARMEEFMHREGFVCDIETPLPGGMRRLHHELYLSDPRKTIPEKNRVLLRHPVRRR